MRVQYPSDFLLFRNEIRSLYFSVRIWKYMEKAGYAWVMRMDDDSFLRSKVGTQYMTDVS